MSNRKQNMQEHAAVIKARLEAVLKEGISTSPELLDWSDRNIGFEYISDLIADVFTDAIDSAEREDKNSGTNHAHN